MRGSTAVWLFMLSVDSAHIALPVSLLRYVSHGAGSAQWAASRRRPLYPRAPASKIATSWYLRLITAGFGSGRGSIPAKHGPQPAFMRAAPAFRERLSDVEAASTGSFSCPRPGGESTASPGRVGRIRRSRHPAQRCASVRPDTAAPRRRRYSDGAARRKGCP